MSQKDSDRYTKGLEVYLVGGAVRDQLLGLQQGDRDWVITGTTQEEMLQRGFRQVGKDFPVFLHPDTSEEYALARTERKVSPGYHGFELVSDPSVTLEQDLSRRDLTINAMALDSEENLIDPWGGQLDLEKGLLRHVSEAFAEDPVRILRIARFAARFEDKGFTVAPDTITLMQEMVSAGEVKALVAERVWQELEKSLKLPGFYRFIEVLRESGALAELLPEVEKLFGVPQSPEYHPEIDTGVHIIMALKAAVRLKAKPEVVFAVLTHDLGKGITPIDKLPSHPGHEKSGIPLVEGVCERFRVPKEYRAIALLVCEFHLHLHRIAELRASTVLKMIEKLDGFRQADRVDDFTTACFADKRGRLGLEEADYHQAAMFKSLFAAACAVDTKQIVSEAGQQGLKGKAIGEQIRHARLTAIKQAKAQDDIFRNQV